MQIDPGCMLYRWKPGASSESDSQPFMSTNLRLNEDDVILGVVAFFYDFSS